MYIYIISTWNGTHVCPDLRTTQIKRHRFLYLLMFFCCYFTGSAPPCSPREVKNCVWPAMGKNLYISDTNTQSPRNKWCLIYFALLLALLCASVRGYRCSKKTGTTKIPSASVLLSLTFIYCLRLTAEWRNLSSKSNTAKLHVV